MDKPPGRDSTRRRHRPNTPTRPGRNGGSRGLGRHERGSHQREHESRRHGSRRCDHRRSGHRQNLQNDLRQNDLHLRGLRLHLEPGPSSELLRHHPEGQLPESSSLLFEPSKSPSPFFEVSRSLHALFFCARNERRPAPFGGSHLLLDLAGFDEEAWLPRARSRQARTDRASPLTPARFPACSWGISRSSPCSRSGAERPLPAGYGSSSRTVRHPRNRQL
jgi:hypothetical protein